MTASPWVRDVTEANFEADVVQASQDRPVVVDFWAPWCQPCQLLGPVLERLIDEREGRLLLAKINTEEAQELASWFQISAIPAVKIFYQGQILHQFEGVLPESALRELFDQLAPVKDPALIEAEAAEQAAPAKAEASYRGILAASPDNDEARLGLARVLLAQGKLSEIAEVLEPVAASGESGTATDALLARVWLLNAAKDLPDLETLRNQAAANPKNAQARLDLGLVQAAHEQYEPALENLLAAAEQDFKLASGRVREVMVKVFFCLGASHPLSNDYRVRLSRLLY